MTVSAVPSGSGSQTATINTEHTLGPSAAAITTAGTYQLWLDVSALAGGVTPDILEIREYGKARTGDTERLIKVHSIIGAQSEALFVTEPRGTPHYARYTIKQIQGTGRAFPWQINQY